MSSELIRKTLEAIRPLDDADLALRIESRWNSLTKPPGSLGRIEDMVVHLGLIQGTVQPGVARRAMFLFCADHGVTEEGVSAFPSEVTRQMVRNFLGGGAAISVLCRQFDIEPIVIDMGVRGAPDPGSVALQLGQGTANFTKGPAMTRQQAIESLENGIELAAEAARRFDLAGVGEMGIGNTTSAAALLSAFSGLDPDKTVGAGTGLDEQGLYRKSLTVRTGLQRNRDLLTDPIGILSAVGGFEIGGMAGFLLGAAAHRLPVVVDGFISCSAALIARALAPDSLDAVICSHQSAERGHRIMLEILGLQPFFALDMRLGEGSGAALTMNLLDSAVRLYNEMATFEQASVSEAAKPASEAVE
ncbi:MAG: nicotinate-nucleotide--dimethylbenzimidazole phosphoribosyltransferase [Bryobacteraceae bacterium]